jgi:hypothetical protein
MGAGAGFVVVATTPETGVHSPRRHCSGLRRLAALPKLLQNLLPGQQILQELGAFIERSHAGNDRVTRPRQDPCDMLVVAGDLSRAGSA